MFDVQNSEHLKKETNSIYNTKLNSFREERKVIL